MVPNFQTNKTKEKKPMIVSIDKLPTELFHVLATYLVVGNEYHTRFFRFSFDWRNFLNTHKKYFGELKMQHQILALNPDSSRKFNSCSYFRERILNLIEDPSEQLQLMLTTSLQSKSFKISESSKSIPVETNLSEYRFDDNFSIWNCKILSVSRTSLNGMHAIKFLPPGSNSRNILKEAIFKAVDLCNYQALSHLTSVSISNTYSVTDVSCFRNAKKLNFSCCPNIIDVSSLGNVHEPELLSCNGITDVSSLGEVHRLNLSNSQNIEDVSALGNVHDLNLSGCRKVKNISSLGNGHILNLEECPLITDVSMLNNVYELHLHGFTGDSLSGLKNVQKLYLEYSNSIKDITMLDKLMIVCIKHCYHITSIEGLDNLKQLELGNGLFLFNFGKLIGRKLQTLTLRGGMMEEEPASYRYSDLISWCNLVAISHLKLILMSFIRIPSTLVHLQTLHVKDWKEFSFLPELPSLGDLVIDSCQGLLELSLFGEEFKYPLYNVEIYGCSHVKRIAAFCKVSKMKVANCNALSNLETIYRKLSKLENGYTFYSGETRDNSSSKISVFNNSEISAIYPSKISSINSSEIRANSPSCINAANPSKISATNSSEISPFNSSEIVTINSSKISVITCSEICATNSSKISPFNSSEIIDREANL
jgi:hypothetical protein